jgi:cytochrome c biogenesis protein
LKILRSLLALVTSTRLGIAVMVVLALLSLLGAIIPQGGPEQAYRETYGNVWGGLIWKTGVSHIFHTDYFTFLLVLLCGMVFTCALRRLPRQAKLASRKTFILDEERLAGFPESGAVVVDLEADEAALHVEDICKRRYYRISRKVEDGKRAVFASKAGFARFGSSILHLSFIFLLAGGIATTRLGTRGYREVRVGEGFVLEQAGRDSTVLNVNDFTVETDEAGRLSDYVCEVTVEHGDSVLMDYRIRPNHPLSYKGQEVFLNSYAEDSSRPEAFALSVYDSVGTLIVPHTFAPVDGRLYVDELEGSLQATLGVVPGVRLFTDDGKIESYVLEREVNPPEGVQGRYQFVLMYGVPAILVTLEVVKEPFQGLIIAGLGLLTAGTAISLYLSHRRIWFIISAAGGGKTRIVFGGAASRNPEGYSDEFEVVRRTLDELA